MKINNRYLFWPFVSNGFSDFHEITDESQIKNKKAFIIHGNGRSYSHCCLNDDKPLLSIRKINKVILFNKNTGELRAQAGITIKEIHDLVKEYFWVVNISPGTQYVTLGGCVANDIHGKNYHSAGSFIQSVNYIKIIRSDGKEYLCSRKKNKSLFLASFGGLGLTGVITEISINLKKVRSLFMDVQKLPFNSMQEFVKLSEKFEDQYEYSVGWMDCVSKYMGRGFIFNSNFLKTKQNKIDNINKRKINLRNFPLIPVFNKFSIPIFNYLYYMINKLGKNKFTQHFEKNLYPLDAVLGWNRLYGTKGFFQLQLLVPINNLQNFEVEFFNLLKKYKLTSFLVVLKLFTKFKESGMLSFPKNGLSIALDFRNNIHTPDLIKDLQLLVKDCKGRTYLAKDAFINKKMFQNFYPEFNTFKKYMDVNLSSNMKRKIF